MAEYSYKAIKGKSKTFRAMTGIDLGEFTKLLPYFHQAYMAQLIVDGHDSETRRGRPGNLATMEDKLFFILYYLKTYPLQEVLGYSFNLSQGLANRWIHRLCPILQSSLKSMGHAPARLPEEVLERLSQEMPQALGLDATERRIQRPIDDVVQEEYYSGKKIPFGEE
jgi:transposase